MRASLRVAPMILGLLLLTGCWARGGDTLPAQELALEIRGKYLALEDFSTQADLVADYGQRVYSFTLDVQGTGEELTLTITQPELVAGVTAHVKEGQGYLEYDTLMVETGPLDGAGLTPISAVPVMLEAAREGYLAHCTLEEEPALLRVQCSDPELPPGQGREITLWFSPDTGALVQGEICVDGVRRIQCTYQNFTMG